jgi:hypothetical protein
MAFVGQIRTSLSREHEAPEPRELQASAPVACSGSTGRPVVMNRFLTLLALCLVLIVVFLAAT